MLDNIRVASPCSADWEKMEGNDRVRFCNACQLNVYNFSEMTEREVRQLIQSHEGRRLCGRLYKRKDGTILTRNCPVGLRAVVRRLSRVAGAILSFMTPGFAAAQTQTNIQSNDSRASLEVHATDLFGVAITNAQVILTQSSSNKTIQGRTDSEGRLLLYADANGDYTMKVTAPGFQPKEDHVKLSKGDAVSLQVVLQVSASMGRLSRCNHQHPCLITLQRPARRRTSWKMVKTVQASKCSWLTRVAQS